MSGYGFVEFLQWPKTSQLIGEKKVAKDINDALLNYEVNICDIVRLHFGFNRSPRQVFWWEQELFSIPPPTPHTITHIRKKSGHWKVPGQTHFQKSFLGRAEKFSAAFVYMWRWGMCIWVSEREISRWSFYFDCQNFED